MKASDRIKDPEAVILPPDHVLLEVFLRKTPVVMISKQDEQETIDYIRIVKINPKEECVYEVGDIVLDIDNFMTVRWETNGRFFIKMPINNIKLVVKKENFIIDSDLITN